MLLTSCGQHCRVMRSLCYVLLLNAALLLKLTEALSEGDACIMKSVSGVCTLTGKCTSLEAAIQRREINVSDIVSCGFDLQEEIICCPTNGQATTNPTNPTKTTVPFTTTTPATSTASPTTDSSTMTTVTTPKYERPAVRACRLIEADLKSVWESIVYGGTPVKLGDYPHMVAIGYSAKGKDAGPYEFRCGGSLIDKKFVLTAAHCVSSRKSQPSIVRMGVTNFTDEEQMRNVVEIKIKKIHIHPEFTNSRKYNDIAIMELERSVDYSDTIHATCLYTELTDPPSESDLYVTGWGIDETRHLSKHLLEAKLQITSVESCNQTYADIVGHNRLINRGIDNTQLCAFDPEVRKDACEGDSGGPLNLVLDLNPKKYRVVGIISSGFPCGTTVPGLYTRVAPFLNYIEGVVWPSLK